MPMPGKDFIKVEDEKTTSTSDPSFLPLLTLLCLIILASKMSVIVDGVAVPKQDLQYGYIPTLWVCATFVTLFGLSTLIHFGQVIRSRTWWLLPTIVLGGIGEVIGWSGRLWSSKTFLANAKNPYFMQITSTIIAPTPILAANFVILGRLIAYLGPQYSRLTPKWYTIIFCSVDVIALVAQAYGGATASGPTTEDGILGGHIMLGGIIFQLVSVIIFSTLAFEFFFRYFKDEPVRAVSYGVEDKGFFDQKIRRMVFGLSFSTLCIFIRAIYRTIELADGWTGRIITTEIYFNYLDGMMILLAIYTMNFCHPGSLLPNARGIASANRSLANDAKNNMRLEPMINYPRGSSNWENGSSATLMKKVEV